MGSGVPAPDVVVTGREIRLVNAPLAILITGAGGSPNVGGSGGGPMGSFDDDETVEMSVDALGTSSGDG